MKSTISPYPYPLLEKVFNHYGQSVTAANFYLVCCQHLLEPQLKMFEHLIAFGFDPEKIIVLGKAYSSNQEIISLLTSKGVNVLQPPFSGTAFDEEHRNNCQKVLDLVPQGARVIILDDGGELIKVFVENNRKVLFAVEQTSSGFRKLENEQIKFPVINVARSATKLVQESPLVARLCFERIKDYLTEKKVFNPAVLVVGLGAIGEAILEVFKQAGFRVEGFDIKHGHKELPTFITKTGVNIVVGASGFPVLEKSEVEAMVSANPLYFVSVSSSDREFPVANFRQGNTVHQDIVYKNITFVNNGFPITFKGNKIELTPVEIEKTICLLGGSVVHGVVFPLEQKGIVEVPKALEDIINS